MQESQMADCATQTGPPEAEAPYIAPDKITLLQFVPPVELAPFVTQIYFFECEELHIHDRQPAALGHLVFLLRGSGQLQFHDGHIDPIRPATLFGPGMAAAAFTFAGPVSDLGFALSPLGFVALTGKPANLYADRAISAADLFGDEIDGLAEQFRAGLEDGSMRLTRMIELVSNFLLTRAKSIAPSHLVLIRAVTDWLSSDLDPDVDRLYASLPVSRSTAVRLITRYFGSPPKPLMRKYRALRAASLLVDPACTPELRARLESLFYDQPHMIREIRHFAGRTPAALDGDDSRILRLWLSKDNFRDLEAYPG
jgi:AraC-like DNA-binding protein